MLRHTLKLVLLVCLVETLVSVPANAQPPLPKLPVKPPMLEGKLPGPPEALKQLLGGLSSNNSEERFRAAEQLQEVAPEFTALATTALTKALEDQNDNVRFAALNTLGGIGPSAKQALPAVQQRMKSAQGEYERALATWVATQLTADRQSLVDAIPELVKSLSSENEAISNQAADALVAFGLLAEPALVKSLQGADSRGSLLALDALGQIGAQGAVPEIAKRLTSNDAEVRAAAVATLGAIGPASQPAVPMLLKALADDSSTGVRARSAAALASIDARSPQAIQALVQATSQTDATVVREAIRALVQLQADANTITPLATKLLADSRPEVVTEAMAALAEQGPAALPFVKEALKSKDSQYLAVLMISDLGSTAKETVPPLVELLGSAPNTTKREALMALGKMGPEAATAVPQIARELSSDDPTVRYAAVYALGRIGAKSDDVEQKLNQNLNSSDAFLKLLSAWALAKLNPNDAAAATRAIELLAAGLTSQDKTVQQGAALCLVELKPAPGQVPQLIPKFLAALGTPDESVQLSVLEALQAAMADASHPSLLIDLFLKEPLRPLAAMIARRLGAKAKGALPAMTEALNDPRPQVRRDIALAMAAMGPDASSAAPALIAALQDADPDVRRAAALALGSIGPGAKGAVAPLSAIVAGTDEAAKPVAAWALVFIASDDAATAKAVLPLLVQQLKSQRSADRQQSAQALGRLGSKASSALPDLKYASSDQNAAVRKAAQRAVQNIQSGK